MDKSRKLPIYKIVPIEDVFTEIAITDNPAIDEFFLMFNSTEENIIKLEFKEDKQIITGPVMIPNRLIYRNDSIGERFVMYDEEGIKESALLFMKNGLKINKEHTDKLLPINIIESYFAVEGNSFGVPVGSWIVSAKVNDKELWKNLKENKSGFSFQGLFSNELIGIEQINNFNKQQKEEKMDLKEKLSAAINAVLFGETKVEEVTKDVETIESVEEFAAGDPVADVPTAEVVAPEVEDVEVVTEEKVKAMIDEAIVSATEQIIASVKEMLGQSSEEVATAMSAMSIKLEEFGKQPLTQPINEIVNNTKSESSFDYLKGIKL